MSGKKISELTELSSGAQTDNDVIPLVNAGVTKKFKWSSIKASLKTYFDTLYPSGSGTSTGTNTGDQSWGDIGGTLSDQSDLQTALNAKENSSNKATDLSSNDHTHFPTTAAVQSAINSAVAGLLDYRGTYDASSNTYPSSGGSGSGGAILKGDFYVVSVAGNLGGNAVSGGDLVIAVVDSPGSTPSNWDLVQHNLGFTPENVANKDTDGALSANSDTKYASQKATKTYADTKQTAHSYLTQISGLTPSNDDFIQLKSGVWVNRTISQVKSDLGINNVNNTADSVKVVASAATLTTARKIDGISFDGSADVIVNHTASIYAALGSAAKGFHWVGAPGFSNGALNALNSTLYLQAMWVPKDCTLTGVQWIQLLAGDYTANNYNGVGLYTYSGGTLTLVASSTNDGNIWKGTANTLLSKAFSSTYSAAAGLYFVGALWCRSAQVTAPAIMRPNPTTPNNAILTLDFTNSAKLSGTLGSVTALPSSQAMSGVAANNLNVAWFQLY